MQIIKYNENIDKFTGFFNKKRAMIILVSYCNITLNDVNMSVVDSDMTAKSFSSPRNCPHLR